MRILDKQKKIGQDLAKSYGHSMSRWYREPGGYYISECGYIDHCEMYLEMNYSGKWELWGDAVDKKYAHKYDYVGDSDHEHDDRIL